VPIIDVRNDPPQDDPDAIAAGLNAVAAEIGVPLATVLKMPWAEITPILERLRDQVETDARELAADALVMRNLATLAATLPEGMTIGQGIAAGLVAEVDAIRAGEVTEADVDDALAVYEWRRRAEDRARRRPRSRQ